MEIRTILVNMDVDGYRSALLASAIKLALQYQASLIGLAACELPDPSPGAAGTMALKEWPSADRPEVEARLASLETEYLALVPAALRAGFIRQLEPLTSALLRAARRADLVLLDAPHGARRSLARHVDVAEVLLSAGRPVLIAATGSAEVIAGKILIGWKDTREARRALADALPLLHRATNVVVATLGEGDDVAERISLAEVVDWLERHGITARGDVYPARGGPAESLADLAKWLNADLIVTGAYGHSRFREWLLGGMTSDLIAAPTVARLMSN